MWRDLLRDLLQAKTVEEVQSILQPYLDEGRFAWRPYGGKEGLSATIKNQQATPEAALVEKVTNAMDAILMRACLERGLDPERVDVRSPREAAQAFGVQSKPVQVLFQFPADGNARPNIYVVDEGEGQRPEDFPRTFLSLNESNKDRIPFVHGRFNMGGAGALPFCRRFMQLVVSRRFNGGPWGFTITRLRPARPGEKLDVVEYLVCRDTGQVPEADALTLPTWFPTRLACGTVIKLFEYHWPQAKGKATIAIVKTLTRLLTDPVLPVQVWSSMYGGHRRGFTTVRGLKKAVTTRSRARFRVPLSVTVGEDEGQATYNLTLEVFALQKEARVYEYTVGNRNQLGVYVAVHGQTHGRISRGIFREAGLVYLQDWLVGLLDLGGFRPSHVDRITMPSRDRLREGRDTEVLYRALVEALRTHEGLRRLNEQVQRERARQEQRSVEENLSEVLSQMIYSNPVFRRLLADGEALLPSLPRSGASAVAEEPEAPNFPLHDEPTFLRYVGPRNRRRPFLLGHAFRLRFDLDARDGFFDRGGVLELEVDGQPLQYSTHNLHQGRLVVVGGLPLHFQEGAEFVLKTIVKCPSGRTLEESILGVMVSPKHRRQNTRLRLPRIILVPRAQWTEYGFTETTTGMVLYGAGTFDVLINADAVFVPKPEVLRNRYYVTLASYALALVAAFKPKRETEERDEWLENVQRAFNGLGVAVAAALKTVDGDRAPAAVATVTGR